MKVVAQQVRRRPVIGLAVWSGFTTLGALWCLALLVRAIAFSDADVDPVLIAFLVLGLAGCVFLAYLFTVAFVRVAKGAPFPVRGNQEFVPLSRFQPKTRMGIYLSVWAGLMIGSVIVWHDAPGALAIWAALLTLTTAFLTWRTVRQRSES
ncbi:hypothetical protein ACGFNU_33785 [Spirillospora sp. NPDC048911]|uniref:hypothetical protein n=1 Tax=Spirillospora sp. NPDC048911 TaxID=3364527 RepID=UPI00371C3F0C